MAEVHWLKRLHVRLHAHPVSGALTKIIVTVVGLLVLTAGLVMMVTPGPGVVGILAGLGLLALEWEWARRWLTAARQKAAAAADTARTMDPAVRRRRVLLLGLGAAVACAVVAGLVWHFGWPGFGSLNPVR